MLSAASVTYLVLAISATYVSLNKIFPSICCCWKRIRQQRNIITEENPSLPEELIVLILLRLPVRSLLRFKCVSKWWLSVISDPEFAKSHCNLAATPTHRLLLKYTEDFQIQSLDIESSSPPPPPNHESAAALLNYPLDGSISFLTSVPSLEVLGSCRGFILFRSPNYSHDFLVCNPSTGLQRRIPSTSLSYTASSMYGFGYDKSTDDYLLVDISSNQSLPMIKVFSLKTNLPFSLDLNYEYQYLNPEYEQGLFFNGSLHWFVTSRLTKLVLAFDLIERSLSEIALSHDLAPEFPNHDKLYLLRVMRGCLAVCYSGLGGMTKIWIMKEYRVQSSWTKIVLSAHGIPRDSQFFPICFTKCGDVFGSNELGRLLRLDNKGKLLAVWPKESTYRLFYSCIYTASLLSLPS